MVRQAHADMHCLCIFIQCLLLVKLTSVGLTVLTDKVLFTSQRLSAVIMHLDTGVPPPPPGWGENEGGYQLQCYSNLLKILLILSFHFLLED